MERLDYGHSAPILRRRFTLQIATLVSTLIMLVVVVLWMPRSIRYLQREYWGHQCLNYAATGDVCLQITPDARRQRLDRPGPRARLLDEVLCLHLSLRIPIQRHGLPAQAQLARRARATGRDRRGRQRSERDEPRILFPRQGLRLLLDHPRRPAGERHGRLFWPTGNSVRICTRPIASFASFSVEGGFDGSFAISPSLMDLDGNPGGLRKDEARR